MRRIASLTGVFALLLTACAVGPDYRRPDLPVPESYVESAPAGDSAANVAWFDLFGDEVLKEIIREALRENQDMKSAVARIEAARAQLGFTRADQWPSLAYVGQAARSRSLTVDPISLALGRDPFGYAVVNDTLVAAQAQFEIDLWGRLRRSTEAARSQLLATEEARRAVAIALVSEVASTYFLLLDMDERLRISRDTLASRNESLRIIRLRFEGGITSELDVNQAEIQAGEAEAYVAGYERSVAQTEHALCLLLGRPPGPVTRGEPLDNSVVPPEIPAGLPSDLLENRPDVRAAEEQFHAATAQVGVAVALRLPSFSLTGLWGRESRELSNHVSGGTTVWNAQASLLGPLFEFGKNKRRVEAARAEAEQALYAYEKAVLSALRDVEDGLVAVRTFRAQHEAVARQTESAANALRLSKARYDAGITSYLEVLDTERMHFSTRLAASQTLQQQLAAVVGLYKALGGGWTPEAEDTSPPPPES